MGTALYTKKEIAGQLRRLYHKLRRPINSLDIREASRRGECVSFQTLLNYFGSLESALKAAKVPHLPPRRRPRVLPRGWMSSTEAAQILGIDSCTVTQWSRQGMISMQVAPNGQHLFPAKAVKTLQRQLDSEEELLTPEEAAEILGVSVMTVWRLTNESYLTAVEIVRGKRHYYRYRRSALRAKARLPVRWKSTLSATAASR